MQAAREALGSAPARPRLIAVTVLTSHGGGGSARGRDRRHAARARRCGSRVWRRPAAWTAWCARRRKPGAAQPPGRGLPARHAGHPPRGRRRRRSEAHRDARRGDRDAAPAIWSSVARSPALPIRWRRWQPSTGVESAARASRSARAASCHSLEAVSENHHHRNRLRRPRLRRLPGRPGQRRAVPRPGRGQDRPAQRRRHPDLRAGPGAAGPAQRRRPAGCASPPTSRRACATAQFQFIAVGTPPDEDGSADLRYVLAPRATSAAT